MQKFYAIENVNNKNPKNKNNVLSPAIGDSLIPGSISQVSEHISFTLCATHK